ncbi:ParE-like toxin of type II ParDE toxin-antitoxin system [Jejuia pallidilutea]|uniref:ParE-like toxin of type II ParDE toxin-antitoxin system n=1 Tax=Jejuia pallidilutea TaxID=504487 RepID=A0A362X3I4_9FLAO|nr:type II toxin-antitoxin system RelE/ParE family toxin [Jejuia pallidilutea]PQV49382.1 ParE-like toxin of type II ParDE toxin-antitoxin system [Jejuia pallidilutea]
MKYIIEFEEGTLDNFLDAIAYYEKTPNTLSDRFNNEFWAKIGTIKERPLPYQIRYKGIRVAHTKIFPFGIHFIVDGTAIRVLKILHHKQYYK